MDDRATHPSFAPAGYNYFVKIEFLLRTKKSYTLHVLHVLIFILERSFIHPCGRTAVFL